VSELAEALRLLELMKAGPSDRSVPVEINLLNQALLRLQARLANTDAELLKCRSENERLRREAQLAKARGMILASAISVKGVKSATRTKLGEVIAHDDATVIQAGEEVKQFGEVDSRGQVLIRWKGHTYLARESDLKQKQAPAAGE
jgi:hypothetical protein